jgi:RHS repeat-associated protein
LRINPSFSGYDRSWATSLDYAVNRFYSTGYGFIQPDPLGSRSAKLSDPQSFNGYAFVRNDPVNATDPTGLAGEVTCYLFPDGRLVCPGEQQEGIGLGAGGSTPGASAGRGEAGGGGGGPDVDRPQTSLQEALFRGLGGRGQFVPSARPATQLDLLATSVFAAYAGVAAISWAAGGVAGALSSAGRSSAFEAAAQGKASEVELLEGLEGQQVRFPSLTETAAYRVADLLSTEGVEALAEVKNVATLSLTDQIADGVLWAQAMGIPYVLITRLDTVLSAPLLQQIYEGHIDWVPGL